MKVALIIIVVLFVATVVLKLSADSWKKHWQKVNPDRVAEIKRELGEKYTALPDGYTRGWNWVHAVQILCVLAGIICGLIWWLV